MPFDASDIDIFVLTYNRASLLPVTLRSLLDQSVRGATITVLDNASTDGTRAVVQPFAKEGVRYECALANLGWAGNLVRAQQQASKAWTLVFHDDDLLHPDYLRHALNAINVTPAVGLVLSTMSFEAFPEESNWSSDSPRSILCPHVAALAAVCYAGTPIHFGSAIYRTSVFKSLKWESDRYGKIADRPFLLAAVRKYAAYVFLSPLVRYRIHSQQDSASSDSGPFAPQLAALHHCYRTYLGENPLSQSGLCFLQNNFRSIRDEYPRLGKGDKEKIPSLADYKLYVLEHGGSSRFALLCGSMLYTFHAIWIRLRQRLHYVARRLNFVKTK